MHQMQGFGGVTFPMGYGNLGGMQYGFSQGLNPLQINQAQMHPTMAGAQASRPYLRGK
jgi:hypothetical protein